MSFSNYLEENTLNHFFKNIPTTSPGAVYLALYISDPTEFDTGTEVSGGGYSRQIVNFGANTTSGNKTVITNNADIQFNVAESSWGTITHMGIRDSQTGGNLLVYAPFSVSRAIETGDQFYIPTGKISISLD